MISSSIPRSHLQSSHLPTRYVTSITVQKIHLKYLSQIYHNQQGNTHVKIWYIPTLSYDCGINWMLTLSNTQKEVDSSITHAISFNVIMLYPISFTVHQLTTNRLNSQRHLLPPITTKGSCSLSEMEVDLLYCDEFCQQVSISNQCESFKNLIF